MGFSKSAKIVVCFCFLVNYADCNSRTGIVRRLEDETVDLVVHCLRAFIAGLALYANVDNLTRCDRMTHEFFSLTVDAASFFVNGDSQNTIDMMSGVYAVTDSLG